MHAELFFVGTDQHDAVVQCVLERLNSPPDPQGKQPVWGLDNGYDLSLASGAERKVAISPVADGWIAGIESKQALDFKLLQTVSERLEAEVVACQISTSSNYYGYARCIAGKIVESKCCEDGDDPLLCVRSYLRTLGVPFGVITFPEAIRLRSVGWRVLKRG